MAVLAKKRRKQRPKPMELMPSHLDFFEQNGLDIRLELGAARGHAGSAREAEGSLARKSLARAQGKMDDYLQEYRAAERALLKIVLKMTEPGVRAKFLATFKNVSPEEYDARVDKLAARADRYGRRAWTYERMYAKKYGKQRPEYASMLLARKEARRIARGMWGAEPETEAVWLAKKSVKSPGKRKNAAAGISPAEKEKRETVKYARGRGDIRIAKAEAGRYRRGIERGRGSSRKRAKESVPVKVSDSQIVVSLAEKRGYKRWRRPDVVPVSSEPKARRASARNRLSRFTVTELNRRIKDANRKKEEAKAAGDVKEANKQRRQLALLREEKKSRRVA